MEDAINFKRVFQMLRKRFWIISVITLVITIISAILSFFVLTPIYESKTQILVNQAKSDQQLYNATEVQTNIQLINTYNVIIKSPAILDKVKDDLNLHSTIDELNNQISVSSATDSQVVEITVQDPSPYVSAKIANKTAEVFRDEISKIMNVDNVSILSKATVKSDVSPVKPQPLINIGIALIMGLVISVAIVILMEYLDNTIKTEEDIENILDLPVMGVINNIEDISPEAIPSRNNITTSTQRRRGETVGS